MLTGMLTRLGRGDILFIDEIHRLSAPVEEALYPAIEDFRIDVTMGDGAFAESIALDIQPFTLVGATTRTGLLTKPLQERFGVTLRLDFYPVEDLELIVLRTAKLHRDRVRSTARTSSPPARVAPRASRTAWCGGRGFRRGGGRRSHRSSASSKPLASASASMVLVSMKWIAGFSRS